MSNEISVLCWLSGRHSLPICFQLRRYSGGAPSTFRTIRPERFNVNVMRPFTLNISLATNWDAADGITTADVKPLLLLAFIARPAAVFASNVFLSNTEIGGLWTMEFL